MPKADLLTGLDFADMTVRLQNDRTVDVMFKDEIVFWDVATPSTSYKKSRFGFGARTGGANAVHGIDDLRLAMITEPPPADEPPTISISRDDSGNLIVEWTGILQAAENVNGPWADVNTARPAHPQAGRLGQAAIRPLQTTLSARQKRGAHASRVLSPSRLANLDRAVPPPYACKRHVAAVVLP